MKKANAWSLALIPCIGLWLAAAPAWGATAPPLSEVRVFKVQSAGCTETIPERAQGTQMCTHRGPTKVSVMEVGLVSVIFAFLFVDLFDNSGTLIGVAKRAGLMGKDGHMPKMGRALIADSTAAMAGSLLGTSTTTSYIESAAGVSAGGRTGLTAIVVAILFLLALFFSPLAASVPAFATAPALLFVAVLMTQGLAEIDCDDITVAAPVVITALAMPFTYSIANGIAFGFIA